MEFKFWYISAPEPQILDYQAQQHKLFPPLAATFAFHFSADHLWSLYGTANEGIAGGDLQLLPDVNYSPSFLHKINKKLIYV